MFSIFLIHVNSSVLYYINYNFTKNKQCCLALDDDFLSYLLVKFVSLSDCRTRESMRCPSETEESKFWVTEKKKRKDTVISLSLSARLSFVLLH